MPHKLLPQIIETLWSKDLSPAYRVWAVLDGARSDRIYSSMVATYAEHCCLYSGELPSAMKIAAPYLLSLDLEIPTTRYILNQGWGNNWGIFFRSNSAMEALRRHLKKLLVVKDQTGQRMLFRYYDPRVMRAYLPTCWPSELDALFGPIKSYLVEGTDSDSVIQFRLDEGRLLEKVLPLAGDAGTKAASTLAAW